MSYTRMPADQSSTGGFFSFFKGGIETLVKPMPAVDAKAVALLPDSAQAPVQIQAAPAVKAKSPGKPLDIAMKALRDHKDAGAFANENQLIRKVGTAVQHGAAFQQVNALIAKHGDVAKKVLQAVVDALGEKFPQFKADFDKAYPATKFAPVINHHLMPTFNR